MCSTSTSSWRSSTSMPRYWALRPRRTTWSTSRPDVVRTCRCRSSGPASSVSTSRALACAPSVMRSSSPRVRSRIFVSPPPSAGRAASSEPSLSTMASGWSTTADSSNDRRPSRPRRRAMTFPRTPSRCRPGSRIRASRPGFRMLFSPATIPLRGAPSSAPKPAEKAKIRSTMTTAETAWTEAMKYENRHDPYRFFDELRKTPVVQVADKVYAVTGYRELLQLAHDPHVSSDISKSPISAQPAGDAPAGAEHMQAYGREPTLIVSDPAKHDKQRRQVMRHFAPPHSPGVIPNMEADIQTLCNDSLDKIKAKGGNVFDVVDDYAYPVPVAVICKILG